MCVIMVRSQEILSKTIKKYCKKTHTILKGKKGLPIINAEEF